MTKHPGPWLYDSSDRGDLDIVDASEKLVMEPTADGMLAFADDEARRLILAAPELLATLKELADRLVMFNGEGEPLDRARALIAKVEGR